MSFTNVGKRKMAVFYLAVLPAYRSFAFNQLSDYFKEELSVFASESSIDRKVKTDFSIPNVEKIPILRFKKVFLQYLAWNCALQAKTLVLDLNPRSISAWILLLSRRMLRRRTLVWGHVSSRVKNPITSGRLRRIMRKIAHATIVYTYSEQAKASIEIPGSTVYVAPNSLYPQELLGRNSQMERKNIIYSGRLVEEKRVNLLIHAFSLSELSDKDVKLIIIGDGPEKIRLQKLSVELGIANSIEFLGEIYDAHRLQKEYEKSFVSVSSGYVGLSLTQSLGFGVPMIISRDEMHSPEVELYSLQMEFYFTSGDFNSLSSQLVKSYDCMDSTVKRMSIAAEIVSRQYSSEQMFEGLKRAILSEPPLENMEMYKYDKI
jgi:glycosyltransferase involved in cell wall biosynthesis